MECRHGIEREGILFYGAHVWPLLRHLSTKSRTRPDGRHTCNQPLLWNRLVHHYLIHCITNNWPVECGSCKKRERLLRHVIRVEHVRSYCGAEKYKGYEDKRT